MNDSVVDRLNRQLPACVRTLNGSVQQFDDDVQTLTMTFEMTPSFCHSGDIVQGGFVTGMLDAAMSHAVFAAKGPVIRPPATLEIKVSFFAPARAGTFEAHGHVVRMGRSTAFLEGDLVDAAGQVVARATSTVRVIPLKKTEAAGNPAVG